MSKNFDAAQLTVDQLREGGRVEPVDEARIIGFLAMAAELDVDPGNASLWKAYWQVEALLREDKVDDSKLDDLIAEFGDSTLADTTD
jgi:hypothetical protein